MTERAYIVSRTLENKITMAENDGDHALIVTLDALKEILATLKEQDEMLNEQEAVKPRVSTAEQRCGHCNKVIEIDGWKACPWCGKPILWEAVGRSVE